MARIEGAWVKRRKEGSAGTLAWRRILSTGQLCASCSEVESIRSMFVIGKNLSCLAAVWRGNLERFSLRTFALMQMVFSLIALSSVSPCPFISVSFIF